MVLKPHRLFKWLSLTPTYHHIRRDTHLLLHRLDIYLNYLINCLLNCLLNRLLNRLPQKLLVSVRHRLHQALVR